MLTKNWYDGVLAWATKQMPKSKNINGNTITWNVYPAQNAFCFGYNASANDTPSMYYMRTSTGTQGGVIIGTGTKPPTLDDYWLSGDLITSFTYTASVSTAFDSENRVTTITGVYTINNSGSEDFTIGEIGIIAAASGNNANASSKCLMERTVLDSPVTIPVGGFGQVTYTIKFQHPTA